MKPGFVVVGVSHRTAPVELREQLAVPGDSLGDAAIEISKLPHVREAVVVSTCNRVEVYAAGDEVTACASAVRGFLTARAPGASVGDCLYEHLDDAALRHLFRVTSSLDSMVVGEPQILGQVKEAVSVAQRVGTVGPVLQRILSRAFSAAKRVRTETGIASGAVSVSTVAVELAGQIFGDLKDRTVLLLGAGKMALGAARALAGRGARLAVANRNYDRARELAGMFNGASYPLDNLPLLLPTIDVVLCSTGAPRYVVTLEGVTAAMKARRGRSLFVIDISVPRNVDPRVHHLDGVYLFDVDDLEREVLRALENRGGSLGSAENIIEEELRILAKERRASTAGPTIAALRDRFRATARAELERSLSHKLKHLPEADRKALESMLDATVNKLLHTPSAALRSRAEADDGEALAAVVQVLFDLPTGVESSEPVSLTDPLETTQTRSRRGGVL